MKSLLSQLVLAILLCGAALGGYQYWYGVIEEKSASVAALENKIVSHAETETRIATVQASLTEIADYETQIQNYFVQETGVVTFIDALESRGVEQGTVVSVLSVAKGGTTSQPALILSVSVTGTFDAVLRTIGAIEYAPYALTVSGLSLQHDDKTSWHAEFTLQVGSAPSIATTTSKKI